MTTKSMQPGGGGRFEKLKKQLAGQVGIANPGGLAASIGRKKYGKEKFQQMSKSGRARYAGASHNA